MSHECLFARVLAVDSIIPTTQGDKVIPYFRMAINRFLQFTIPVIAIHFELVRFHYRSRLSGFHLYAFRGERLHCAVETHPLTKAKKSIPYLVYR